MNRCHLELRMPLFPGTVWAAGNIDVYPGPIQGREKSGSLACVRPSPGEPVIPPKGPWHGVTRPCSPIVRIHDRNVEDVDSIPLVKDNLVCRRASQDLIRDVWPSQGGFIVGVMAAHIVLGRRTEACPVAPGAGEGRARAHRCPPTAGCAPPAAHPAPMGASPGPNA